MDKRLRFKLLSLPEHCIFNSYYTAKGHPGFKKYQGMVRAAKQVLQVTCFLKANCLEEPHKCRSIQDQGCLCADFCVLEAERDQKAHSRSLCQLLSCHSRPLSPALGQKRVHALDYAPFAVFQGTFWLTPQRPRAGCGELLLFKQHRLWPWCSTKWRSLKSWPGTSSGYFPFHLFSKRSPRQLGHQNIPQKS